jgi:phosphohistidine phosphatase
MHRLHLLRHAKSSRDLEVDDRERGLSRRGREEAERVGARLPAAVGALDLVLCSTARRTRETAELALASFAPMPRLIFDDALYLAAPALLLKRLSGLDESEEAVLMIGHNPGLHELAVTLAAPDSGAFQALAGGKFPTSVRASFAIAGSWSTLGGSRHPLTDYVTVKSLEPG